MKCRSLHLAALYRLQVAHSTRCCCASNASGSHRPSPYIITESSWPARRISSHCLRSHQTRKYSQSIDEPHKDSHDADIFTGSSSALLSASRDGETVPEATEHRSKSTSMGFVESSDILTDIRAQDIQPETEPEPIITTLDQGTSFSPVLEHDEQPFIQLVEPKTKMIAPKRADLMKHYPGVFTIENLPMPLNLVQITQVLSILRTRPHELCAAESLEPDLRVILYDLVTDEHTTKAGQITASVRMKLPDGSVAKVNACGYSEREAASAALMHCAVHLLERDLLPPLLEDNMAPLNAEATQRLRDVKRTLYNQALRGGILPRLKSVQSSDRDLETVFSTYLKGIDSDGYQIMWRRMSALHPARAELRVIESYLSDYQDSDPTLAKRSPNSPWTSLNIENVDDFLTKFDSTVSGVSTASVKDVDINEMDIDDDALYAKIKRAVDIVRQSPEKLEAFARGEHPIKDKDLLPEMLLTPSFEIATSMRNSLVTAVRDGLPSKRSVWSSSILIADTMKVNKEQQYRYGINRGLSQQGKKQQQNSSSSTPRVGKVGLPVEEHEQMILDTINRYAYTIVTGGTGCGKSSQVPQFILNEADRKHGGGYCNIICTQPRRIAAISLAERVAAERNESIGDSVGYRVRHDAKPPRRHSAITYCTVGILLEELKAKSLDSLQHITHIVIDEVHERSVEIDTLLLMLKEARKRGRSIQLPKIILMSATLDAKRLSRWLHDPDAKHKSIQIDGIAYPVRRHFLDELLGELDVNSPGLLDALRDLHPAEAAALDIYIEKEMQTDTIDWIDCGTTAGPKRRPESVDYQIPSLLVLAAIVHACLSHKSGDVLVFLPGLVEIQTLARMLSTLELPSFGFTKDNAREVLTLHSSLSKDEQMRIFNPPDHGRRIILSTNISESSITVPGIRYVVDSCVVRSLHYDPLSNANALKYVPISQASLGQRSGRAGRLAPGDYYALISKETFAGLMDYATPEMSRCDLAATALRMKMCFQQRSLKELFACALLPPGPGLVNQAIDDLKSIEALKEDENLTRLGRILADFILEPRWARVVLLGMLFSCLDPMVVIASITSSPFDMFIRPTTTSSTTEIEGHKQFQEGLGTHLQAYRAFAKLRQVEHEQGKRAARAYAVDNLLSWQAYLSISVDARSITLRLLNAKLDTNPDTGRSSLFGGELHNENAEFTVLIQALLFAGFNQNLARQQSKALWICAGTQLAVLPKPFEQTVVQNKTAMCVYTSLSRDQKHDQLFIKEATYLPCMAALLFCNELTIVPDTMGKVVEINGWRRVRLGKTIDSKLLLEYKKALDRTMLDVLQEAQSLDGLHAKKPVAAAFLENVLDVLEMSTQSASPKEVSSDPTADAASTVIDADIVDDEEGSTAQEQGDENVDDEGEEIAQGRQVEEVVT